MNYLENIINEKLKELKTTELDDQLEFDFFENKIKTITKFNLLNIKNIEPSDFLLARIRMSDKDADFKELYKEVTYIEDSINKIDIDDFCELCDCLEDIMEQNLVKDLFSLISIIFKKNNNAAITTASEILKENFKSNLEAKTFIDLFIKYDDSDSFLSLLYFMGAKEIITDKDISRYLQKNRKVKTKSTEILHDDEKIVHTEEIFEKFNAYKKQLSSKIKIERSKKNKKIFALSEVRDILLNDLGTVTKNVDNFDFDSIDDDELVNKILINILFYNNNIYQENKKEQQKYKNYDLNELDHTLANYGISVNDDEKLLLSKLKNIDEIKSTVQYFDKKSFKHIKNDEKSVFKILLFSNKENLNYIFDLLSNDILTTDFVLNNIDIFVNCNDDIEINELFNIYNINPKFEIFKQNVELLKKINVEMQNIKKYNINIFINDNDSLQKTINLINKYHLDLSDKNLISFKILDNPIQFDLIDNLIELDMINYLNDNPTLLNVEMDTIKKLYICKNLLANDNTEITKVINSNKFYINDSNLNNYIDNNITSHIDSSIFVKLYDEKNIDIDDKIFNDIKVQYLEKNYKINDLQYNFDGIIISRNKFLRNYSTLINSDLDNKTDFIEGALLYNSILNEVEIQKVLNSVEQFGIKSKEKTINNN